MEYREKFVKVWQRMTPMTRIGNVCLLGRRMDTFIIEDIDYDGKYDRLEALKKGDGSLELWSNHMKMTFHMNGALWWMDDKPLKHPALRVGEVCPICCFTLFIFSSI
jgi:hypothetical protein